MIRELYQGNVAFWKCLLFVLAVFAALQFGLHTEHLFRLIPNDSYEGNAIFLAIVLLQTYCATALYECSYTGRFAVTRAFGKLCGALIYFATTYVFIDAARHGNFAWGIIGILYLTWALYKVFWED